MWKIVVLTYNQNVGTEIVNSYLILTVLISVLCNTLPGNTLPGENIIYLLGIHSIQTILKFKKFKIIIYVHVCLLF